MLKLSPDGAKKHAMKARFTMAKNVALFVRRSQFLLRALLVARYATIARHFGDSLVYSEYKVILTKRLAALFPPGL